MVACKYKSNPNIDFPRYRNENIINTYSTKIVENSWQLFFKKCYSALGCVLLFTTFALPFSNADVAKLVDALDLGSSASRHGGSSPSIRTQSPGHLLRTLFF